MHSLIFNINTSPTLQDIVSIQDLNQTLGYKFLLVLCSLIEDSEQVNNAMFIPLMADKFFNLACCKMQE